MEQKISEADLVLDRLAEEIDWRTQGCDDIASHLEEAASDVDDWLSEDNFERVEEAVTGLAARLDATTMSLINELALLNRVRSDLPVSSTTVQDTAQVPCLTRDDLARLSVPAVDDDFDSLERVQERHAADHIRDLLSFATEHWQLAQAASRVGDSLAAAHEHNLTKASLKELSSAYSLWFDYLGQLCEISPGAAGIAGQMTTAFASYLHQNPDAGVGASRPSS